MTSTAAATAPTAEPTDEPTVDASTDAAEEFVYLDPGTIIIGSNVRIDLPDAKEFRRSIKERGVLEAVTVYRNDEDQYVCLRGQRRTVEAASVGTPTGLIPARVVAKPEEADRIVDQMVENIHRAGMRETEIVAGVEELTLVGVSAAQIAKRLSVPRPTVNAALAVTKADQSRNRLDSGDLTLAEAAIFAEFEHDPDAVERLERRLRWGHGLDHEAQRLRDEATERAEYAAEVERLRGDGLPVLTAEEAADAEATAVAIEDLRTAEGDPLPVEDWPSVTGAAVILTEEWDYPEPATSTSADGGSDDEPDEDTDEEDPEPVKVFTATWVVTDVEASGLVYGSRTHGSSSDPASGATSDAEDAARAEGEAEAKRQERRTVIANNKAWVSAETVRRDWLAGFLTRKSAPKGAEALICEAVLTGNYTLSKAMDHRHPMLFKLLGIDVPSGYYGAGYEECQKIVTKATTPKGATMTVLAAVLAAWEDSTGKQTWRNPTGWDARVLGALAEWGYEPSDVERLLLGDQNADSDAA
ncbi:ParB/RepB/Spo0J family partition protein [Nocardioides kribbensis]|uniref:ParB N-terminal domain-containing protein n=1 Tax=Nocardioides kribbensis TaxID=305517 RepID=A0ABV1NTC5_9ACTN